MKDFSNFDIRKYESVLKENPELGKYIDHLNSLSTTDDLTGLFNFRGFQDIIDKEFKRTVRFSQRYPLSMSLIICDLDHFKEYNDRYGHPAGDEILKKVGHSIKTHIRDIDIPCRQGGDEFGIILPETPLDGAKKVAEVLRRQVEGMKIETVEGVYITMSLGIGTYPDHDVISSSGLIKYADDALYFAKNTGRNKVCTYLDLRDNNKAL
jgi:diguanylate cyclase (GGDEF)-like protein